MEAMQIMNQKETESTLFDLGEALLDLGVKGKDAISKFQIVLGDLSLPMNLSSNVSEGDSDSI